MNKRSFGKTGILVSEISLGTWQLGSRWGDPFSEKNALETLEVATNLGINCYDTADVYQDGLSEKTIGKYQSQQSPKPFVITKVGRKLPPG